MGPGDIERMSFSRGQYRFRLKLRFEEPPGENPESVQSLDNKLARINGVDEQGRPTGKEAKRIFIYKLDLMPPDSEGNQYLTMVVRIVDNPIWFPAILLAVGGIVGGSVTYALVEGVDGYREEFDNTVKSVSIAAGLITIFWIVAGGGGFGSG